MSTETELLRKAAALVKGRAEAATPGPWSLWDGWGPTSDGLMGFSRLGPASGVRVLVHDDMRDIYATREDAEHIASWNPSLALAVAAWLLDEARLGEARGQVIPSAVAFARAYLGSDDDHA